MANNNSINFQTINTDSGSATLATSSPGFTIAGTGGIATSATGSTITISGSAIPPTPSSAMVLYEEFFGFIFVANSSTPSGVPYSTGTYSWVSQGDGATTGWQGLTASSSSNPGVISNKATTGFNNLVLCNAAAALNPEIVLGGGAISLNWIIKVATLSAANPRYTLRIGLGDTYNVTTDQANGTYFEYTDNVNSGNWVIKTASASSRTSANTSTAVGTNFVNLGITVNAAATSVAYFVNGTQVANSPITSNIPTAAISPFLQLAASVGTIAAASIIVDAMYLNQTFTTPR